RRFGGEGRHGTVGEQCHVRPFADDASSSERDAMGAVGDLPGQGPVDPLRLEEENRVLVVDRAEEKSSGVRRRRRDDYLDTGRVAEVRLGTLRVVQAPL